MSSTKLCSDSMQLEVVVDNLMDLLIAIGECPEDLFRGKFSDDLHRGACSRHLKSEHGVELVLVDEHWEAFISVLQRIHMFLEMLKNTQQGQEPANE